MNAAKIKQAEQAQTAIATKVLNALPIADEWTVHIIRAELDRKGINIDMRVLSGCLNTLKSSGLARELAGGRWRRVTATDKPQLKAVKSPETPADLEPIDVIADVAARLRTLSRDLSALAEQVESAVLNIESRDASVQQDAEKLRQLKALLQGVA